MLLETLLIKLDCSANLAKSSISPVMAAALSSTIPNFFNLTVSLAIKSASGSTAKVFLSGSLLNLLNTLLKALAKVVAPGILPAARVIKIPPVGFLICAEGLNTVLLYCAADFKAKKVLYGVPKAL